MTSAQKFFMLCCSSYSVVEHHPLFSFQSVATFHMQHVGFIESEATAFDPLWHDLAMESHGSRALPADLHRLMDGHMQSHADRDTVIVGALPKQSRHTGRDGLGAATIQAHMTEYFLRHEAYWIELFIQGTPFSFITADRHYKCRKWVKQDGAAVMTSMSTWTEPEFNVTLATLFNKGETQRENSKGWEIFAERRRLFGQGVTGTHDNAGVQIEYSGVYAKQVPFHGSNWKKGFPLEVFRVFSDSPVAEEPHIWSHLPETMKGAMIPKWAFKIPEAFQIVKIDYGDLDGLEGDKWAEMALVLGGMMSLLVGDAQTHLFAGLGIEWVTADVTKTGKEGPVCFMQFAFLAAAKKDAAANGPAGYYPHLTTKEPPPGGVIYLVQGLDRFESEYPAELIKALQSTLLVRSREHRDLFASPPLSP